MRQYIVPFFIYLAALIVPEITPISVSVSYPAGIFAVACSLFHFRKKYRINFRPGILPFVAGILIAGAWIMLEGHYPMLGPAGKSGTEPIFIAAKLIGSVTVFVMVEELVLRDFMARYLIKKEWESAPIGKFTVVSFIVVTAFFALAHSRWLPALIAGIILNILLIKEKNIGSTILAHGFANLLVGLFVIITGSWSMW